MNNEFVLLQKYTFIICAKQYKSTISEMLTVSVFGGIHRFSCILRQRNNPDCLYTRRPLYVARISVELLHKFTVEMHSLICRCVNVKFASFKILFHFPKICSARSASSTSKKKKKKKYKKISDHLIVLKDTGCHMFWPSQGLNTCSSAN